MCIYNNSKSLILSVVILLQKKNETTSSPPSPLLYIHQLLCGPFLVVPFHVDFFYSWNSYTAYPHTHNQYVFQIHNITVPDCAFNVMHCAIIIIQFHRLFLVEKRDSFSGYTHFIIVYSSLKYKLFSRQFGNFNVSYL